MAQTAEELGVDIALGLRDDEAARRRQLHGPNRLADQAGRSLLRMFVDQFRDFMILVLIAAGVVAGIVGEPQDSIAIALIVVFNGVIGFNQEWRAEPALAAVQACRRAGIVPVMITGDHPTTARAIAEPLQILQAGERVLTRAELALLDDASLQDIVHHVRVFARVVPEQKIRIVQALQARGEFVAMTGDGVNDAPALQRADIGVAMGKGGTDVAREAAGVVLLDDNFATIVSAVREGRRIYDNIRKFVRYAMTGNAAEILTIALAPLAGMPIPPLPIHILWVNLVTDGLPGIALAAEPAESSIMQRPPRRPAENLFAHGLWQHLLGVGRLIAALSLVTQAWALQHNSARADDGLHGADVGPDGACAGHPLGTGFAVHPGAAVQPAVVVGGAAELRVADGHDLSALAAADLQDPGAVGRRVGRVPGRSGDHLHRRRDRKAVGAPRLVGCRRSPGQRRGGAPLRAAVFRPAPCPPGWRRRGAAVFLPRWPRAGCRRGRPGRP